MTWLRSAILLLRRPLAREVEQAADDRRAALGLADDQVEVLRVLAAVGQLLADQVREREDAGERIVELVGDARGEQAHGSELFALDGAGFRGAQLARALRHLLLQRVGPIRQFAPRIAQRDGHGVEGGRHLAELVRAAHRDGLLQVAGGEPLRAGLQVAQRHEDQAVHQQAKREPGQEDESHAEADHIERVPARGAVDFVERVGDVEHAEHRLVLLVRVAGRRVAGGLVAHDLHRREQAAATFGRVVNPPAIASRHLAERLLALVAEETAFGLAVHGQAALDRIGGVDDAAFLVQDPDARDALQVGHVLDDLVHVGGLVVQHREAGALLDHFGQPGDVRGRLVEQRGALVLHDRQRERHHRRRQAERDEQGDLELEGLRAHVAPGASYFAGWLA